MRLCRFMPRRNVRKHYASTNHVLQLASCLLDRLAHNLETQAGLIIHAPGINLAGVTWNWRGTCDGDEIADTQCPRKSDLAFEWRSRRNRFASSNLSVGRVRIV